MCQLASDKLVSFGSTDVGYQVNIIDTQRYAVADSFYADEPVMSPNRHWIAYRHFNAPQSEVKISEEYLLYDLNASATANRRHLTPYTTDAIGWAMYPALPGNAPTNLADIPESRAHVWRSRSFFWGADSETTVLADSVGPNLSLVLVLVKNGKPRAYTHALTSKEICGEADPNASYLNLESASISSIEGGPLTVVAAFKNANSSSSCEPRQLNLSFDDFRPAKVELYQHRKRKQSTPNSVDQ